MSVSGPVYFDEYGHWRLANDIAATGSLSPENTFLPIIRYYPGLETLTAGLHAVTGLPTWHAGQVVILLSHCLSLVVVYQLARAVALPRAACFAAAMVFSLNPSFLYFDTQFSYESLGMTLAFTTLLCALRARRAFSMRARDRLGRGGGAERRGDHHHPPHLRARRRRRRDDRRAARASPRHLGRRAGAGEEGCVGRRRYGRDRHGAVVHRRRPGHRELHPPARGVRRLAGLRAAGQLRLGGEGQPGGSGPRAAGPPQPVRWGGHPAAVREGRRLRRAGARAGRRLPRRADADPRSAPAGAAAPERRVPGPGGRLRRLAAADADRRRKRDGAPQLGVRLRRAVRAGRHRLRAAGGAGPGRRAARGQRPARGRRSAGRRSRAADPSAQGPHRRWYRPVPGRHGQRGRRA